MICLVSANRSSDGSHGKGRRCKGALKYVNRLKTAFCLVWRRGVSDASALRICQYATCRLSCVFKFSSKSESVSVTNCNLWYNLNYFSSLGHIESMQISWLHTAVCLAKTQSTRSLVFAQPLSLKLQPLAVGIFNLTKVCSCTLVGWPVFSSFLAFPLHEILFVSAKSHHTEILKNSLLISWFSKHAAKEMMQQISHKPQIMTQAYFR